MKTAKYLYSIVCNWMQIVLGCLLQPYFLKFKIFTWKPGKNQSATNENLKFKKVNFFFHFWGIFSYRFSKSAAHFVETPLKAMKGVVISEDRFLLKSLWAQAPPLPSGAALEQAVISSAPLHSGGLLQGSSASAITSHWLQKRLAGMRSLHRGGRKSTREKARGRALPGSDTVAMTTDITSQEQHLGCLCGLKWRSWGPALASPVRHRVAVHPNSASPNRRRRSTCWAARVICFPRV